MSEELKELSITAMGRRIRVIRERKEITREELAEKMDISPAFISDVEYGNKGMSIKNLYLLSQLLGVSAEYLLSGKLYSLDNEEESLRVHEEIVSLLKECTPEQIESFRRISQIFADDMKRVAPEKTKSSIKFKK
ncbi:MAG: helix-turn-helix domain-containing protein [Anaerovoracaceae bacterium]